MKTDLAGLFANVIAALPVRKAGYYEVCLQEVLGHIKDVVAGKHTIQEFAEQYCLTVEDDKPPREEWPSVMDGAATPFADNH